MKQFKFYLTFFILMVIAFTITGTLAHAQAASVAEEQSVKSLEESLEFVVAKAIEIAETTGEFVVEQAPLLLQEFYALHIIKSIIGMGISFIVALTFFLLYHFKVKTIIDEKDYWDTPGPLAVHVIIPLIAMGVFFVWAYNLMFILVAPKLYLIEHFMSKC